MGISSAPYPALISDVAVCARHAATRSEDLACQLRIMVDAVDVDGSVRVAPEAMVRLAAAGRATLDDIATFRLSGSAGPASSEAGMAVAPRVT